MKKITSAILGFVTAMSALAVQPPLADKVANGLERTDCALSGHDFMRFNTVHNGGKSLPRAVANPSLPARSRAAASSDLPEIHGCVIARADWTSSSAAQGLYTLPAAEGEEFTIDIAGVKAVNGGVAVEDTYYATTANDFGSFLFVNVGVYDLKTGKTLKGINSQSPEAICFDSTYDTTTGKIYGITYNSNKTSFQLTEIS